MVIRQLVALGATVDKAGEVARDEIESIEEAP